MKALPALLLASVAGACSAGSAPVVAPPTPAPAVEAAAGLPAAAGASAANVSRTAGGDALVSWIEPAAAGAHRLRVSRFAGGTWGAPRTVAEGSAIVLSDADVPQVVEGGDGRLVASWAESAGAGYHVVLARSGDGGATWTRLARPHEDASKTEHGFVSLLPDDDGVLVLWLDGRATASGGATALRAARAGVRGEQMLDERVCDCCPTSAVLTHLGAAVVYRDRGNDEVRDISIVRRLDGRWSQPAPVHRDGWTIDGCPVNGPAAAAQLNRVAVAWYTEAGKNPRVLVAFSRDGGARFDEPIEIDHDAEEQVPRGRVAIALEPSGSALVSWVAARGKAGVVLARRVTPDGRLGPAREIAATAATRAGGFPHAVVSGDDLLVVWQEPTGDASQLRAQPVPLREIGAVGPREIGAVEPRLEVAPPRVEGSRRGQIAPPYAVRTLGGAPVDLASLRGKAVLLNFWATWCAPCKQEMPELATLHQKYAPDGLEVVAVSIDDAKDAAKVRAYVAQAQLPFAVWLDPHDRASHVFSAGALPYTLVIDRDGKIVYRRDGSILDRNVQLHLNLALSSALKPQRSGP